MSHLDYDIRDFLALAIQQMPPIPEDYRRYFARHPNKLGAVLNNALLKVGYEFIDLQWGLVQIPGMEADDILARINKIDSDEHFKQLAKNHCDTQALPESEIAYTVVQKTAYPFQIQDELGSGFAFESMSHLCHVLIKLTQDFKSPIWFGKTKQAVFFYHMKETGRNIQIKAHLLTLTATWQVTVESEKGLCRLGTMVFLPK